MATHPDSEHSENTATTVTVFGFPFDDTDADIILRSSDRVDFMVYKVILSKASPVFKDMFSLPQPATETPQDSRPIVDLTENSKVLATLLSAIYPHTSASDDPLSLNDLIAVLDMARKYDMATASRRLLVVFTDSKTLKDSPLEAFCVAYSRELGDAARVAAKASLKLRLTLDDIGEKLQYTNGPAFHRLWKYHRACSAAATRAVSVRNFKWISPALTTWWWSATSASCRCSKFQFTLGTEGSSWLANSSWNDYLDRARNALREHPCSEAVTTQAVLRPSYQAVMCAECRQRICGLSEFSCYLGEEVERVVSEVREARTSFLISSLTLIFVEVPLDLPF